MKTKIDKLPKLMLILCLVASASAGWQSSLAQGRGARFDFAPNKWRAAEFPKANQGFDQMPHSVENGSMPQGSNFLGVDPQMLARPKLVSTPAVAQTHAVVRPNPIPLNNPFNSSFGHPVGLNAPIASLPNMAAPKNLENAAVPNSLPKSSAEKAVSAKLMHANKNPNVSKNVNGRLLHAKHAVGRSAEQLALKPVESYGKNFGYVPGPYLPTTVGSGASTRTAVQGRILRR